MVSQTYAGTFGRSINSIIDHWKELVSVSAMESPDSAYHLSCYPTEQVDIKVPLVSLTLYSSRVSSLQVAINKHTHISGPMECLHSYHSNFKYWNKYRSSRSRSSKLWARRDQNSKTSPPKKWSIPWLKYLIIKQL